MDMSTASKAKQGVKKHPLPVSTLRFPDAGPLGITCA
jgi:hypothetical protein